MKKMTKNDTKYVVTDNLEIVPCIILRGEGLLSLKTLVGLRPEWVNKDSFSCENSIAVFPWQICDTKEQAERKVLDMKIEKLQASFFAERERWTKTCKYLSIFLYIFAALELVQFVVGLFGK